MERVESAYERFAGTVRGAADSARVAGDSIDESLLKTASGADAVDVAAARVEGAAARLATATEAQAAAEQELLAAQRAVAAGEDDQAAAAGRLAAASEALAASERNAAKAAADLGAAQDTQAKTAAAAKAATDEATLSGKKAGEAGDTAKSGLLGMSSGMSKVALAGAATAVGVGILGGAAVKMAADFQDSTTHLVTDAGEQASQLSNVQSGMLQIAAQTGTMADDLSAAMYHIESSGYHGAAGLTLLKTAAEGAKVGGADFGTVAKTLTGTMNAYNMTGDQSVSMMNQLIATVGAGDMSMQDLASSLGNVAPLAAAAGIDFSQVGGAIATMTAQNMSAQQATQDLANTIRSLQAPNSVAVQEMQSLGLNANDVSQNLGKRGLTGTLEMLTQAVGAHVKGGQVLISTFAASKTAAADADTMIKSMPPNLAKLAQSYLAGSTTAKQWSTDLKGLPPLQQHLMQQFGTLADKTNSFNNLLAGGSPAAQTFNAAMQKMLGGATGLNTSLMLTGGRMATFKANTDAVAEAGKKAGGQVDNWSTIQGTFNQKMAQTKASLNASMIAIGSGLLPAVSALLGGIAHILTPIAGWIAHNKTLAAIILGVVGGVGLLTTAILLTAAAFRKIGDAATIVLKAFGLIGTSSAATAAETEVDAAATSDGWLVAGVKMAAQGLANFVKWGAGVVRQFVAASAAAATNAARTAASWAASNAKMLGQGIAQLGTWVAGVGAKFIAAAASAVAQAAATTAAWAAATASTLADQLEKGAAWLAARIAQGVAAAASAVATAATSAAAWVAANLAMVAATGGIVLAIGALIAAGVWLVTHWTEAWDAIKGAVKAVVGWIEDRWNDFTGFIGRAVTWFAGLGEHMWDWLGAGLKEAVNAVIHGINWMIDRINDLTHGLSDAWTWAGIPGIPAIPHVPYLAAGGLITAPGLAMVGEAGRELVAMPQGAQVIPNSLTEQLLGGMSGFGGLSGAASGSGGGNVTVYVDLRGATMRNRQDTADLVNQIGRAVATQVLPSAGVRIRS